MLDQAEPAIVHLPLPRAPSLLSSMAAVDPLKLALAVSGALILCLCLLVLCRIWRRNRYYKKVQVSLDEEERAFQETLARSYNDEAAIDENDQQKLQMLEELPTAKATMYKAALIGGTLALSVWYVVSIFLLPKRDYNKLHPFTSFIPIWCYMVLRNCSPTLRRYHMHLFAWCGKVTLETYILQFRVWMKTTGINGTPRRRAALLTLAPAPVRRLSRVAPAPAARRLAQVFDGVAAGLVLHQLPAV